MTDTTLTVAEHVRRAIEIDTVAILNWTAGYANYLYTIGNTSHGCPELLLFCPQHMQERMGATLRELSQFMIANAVTPTPHRRLTHRRQHFYPMPLHRTFINDFAPVTLLHYNNSPRITMMQLFHADRKGRFPYDPDYDITYAEQPFLQFH
jgi:hypothetical protein